MIEGALSEKATDFTAGLKAWLLILMIFGLALGVFLFWEYRLMGGEVNLPPLSQA